MATISSLNLASLRGSLMVSMSWALTSHLLTTRLSEMLGTTTATASTSNNPSFMPTRSEGRAGQRGRSSIHRIMKRDMLRKKLKEDLCRYVSYTTMYIDMTELEGELAAVLRDTPAGLEQLDGFLDAVEKLAVTSKHVFTRNQILDLSNDTHLDTIQAIITAARHASPLLLEFKRDAKAFFQPKLPNLEVLSYQLDRYVKTTNMICEKLPRR
ncbi:unnamed protein product [Menidia menidia]|uniref:(Atlantic silverside) hypothetical protein n=1 Tax=Menidia menidia TaxID=238744 RepID=A0A8S4ASU6_9TELE|nr:unnamed protein product [Menidia menidia]